MPHKDIHKKALYQMRMRRAKQKSAIYYTGKEGWMKLPLGDANKVLRVNNNLLDPFVSPEVDADDNVIDDD